MNPKADGFHRAELEADYEVWASLCEQKHGYARQLSREDVQSLTDHELATEIRKLKELARTPRD